jgi:hypothetical protein
MGGYGSGRRGGKPVTEDLRSLNIIRLARDIDFNRTGLKYIWGWWHGEEKTANINIITEPKAIRLVYSTRYAGGEWVDVDYRVPIAWTPCNYGGERPWFVCPGQGCVRRVGKLYLGQKYFLCRHCYDLAYQSTREGELDILLRKLKKLQVQLKGNPGLEIPGRPKGMHEKTYMRKLVELLNVFDALTVGPLRLRTEKVKEIREKRVQP